MSEDVRDLESGRFWLAIAQSCSDCGAERSFKLSKSKPTKQDEEELRGAIGGMWCVEVSCVELTINEIAMEKK